MEEAITKWNAKISAVRSTLYFKQNCKDVVSFVTLMLIVDRLSPIVYEKPVHFVIDVLELKQKEEEDVKVLIYLEE